MGHEPSAMSPKPIAPLCSVHRALKSQSNQTSHEYMADQYSLNERLAELTARGILLKPKRSDSSSYPIGPRKAGALRRFLRDR